MLRRFVFLFFLLAFAFPADLFAQVLGNSPYSKIGVGDLTQPLTIQNIGAGGVSVSNFNLEYLQLNNPALSANKKGLYKDSLVKIEAAFTLQHNIFTSGSSSQKSTAANIRYFAFSLPIGKVWNTTIAIQPYSVKSHLYTIRQPIQGDPDGKSMDYTYQGKGGIYQVMLNNGWGVSKSLSVGLGLGYLFGPSTSTTTTQLVSDPYAATQNESKFGITRKINHSTFAFKPSAHYRKEFYRVIDSTLIKYPQGVFWNVGFTGEFYSALKMTVNESLTRESATGVVTNDSVLTSYKEMGSLPSRFNLGFSLDRPNRWMVGLEGGISDWGTGFSYSTFAQETYTVAWNVGLGGELNLGARKKQLRAWTYRAGVNFATLPYVLDGVKTRDMSVSIGASIPVGMRASGGVSLPKINVAFVVGQRGAQGNTLAKDLYFRFHASILITDKWFTKRRIQ